MENKNTKEGPGPSGGSDLIIITPDELAKQKKYIADNAKRGLKKDSKEDIVEDLEDTNFVSNKTKDKIDVKEKGPVTLKSKILGQLSHSLSKNLKYGKPTFGKKDTPTDLNSTLLTHAGNKATIRNPSKSHNLSKSDTKVLNSDIKFEKHRFVVAQKKINKRKPTIPKKQVIPVNINKSKAQSSDIIEKSIPAVAQSIKATETSKTNVTIRSSNKEPEILSSKFTLGNINSVDDKITLRNDLPFKNIKAFEKTLKQGLREILQNDKSMNKNQLLNINRQISEPVIIIEDSESDSNKPSTSNVTENASFGETMKRDPGAAQTIENTKPMPVEIIDLEKLEDASEPIIAPADIKKEVNIITPLKYFPRKNNEEINQTLSPVKINTGRLVVLEETQISNVIPGKDNETDKSNFIENVPIKIKDIQLDLSKNKTDVNVIKNEIPLTDIDSRKSDFQHETSNGKSDSGNKDKSIVEKEPTNVTHIDRTVGKKSIIQDQTAKMLPNSSDRNIIRNFDKPPATTSKTIYDPEQDASQQQRNEIKKCRNKNSSRIPEERKNLGGNTQHINDKSILVEGAHTNIDNINPNKRGTFSKTDKKSNRKNVVDRCNINMDDKTNGKGKYSSKIANSETILIQDDIKGNQHTEAVNDNDKNKDIGIKDEEKYPPEMLLPKKRGRKKKTMPLESEFQKKRGRFKKSVNLNNSEKRNTKITSKFEKRPSNSSTSETKKDDNVKTIDEDIQECKIGVVGQDHIECKSINTEEDEEETVDNENITVKDNETYTLNKSISLPKQKITAQESSSLIKNNVVATAVSAPSQEISGLEDIQKIPKKRGRPRKSLSKIEKDQTSSAAKDVQINNSNIYKECKADLSEKIEHCYTSSVKNDVTTLNLKENISEQSSLDTLNHPQEVTSKTDITNIAAFVKLPRKRGRPKRIVSSDGIQENNESLLPLEKNSEEIVTPLPKKRSRKRKSSIIIEEFAEPVILDESRNGRKRKKINYFEMENSITDFISEDSMSMKRRRQQNYARDKDIEMVPSKKPKHQVEGTMQVASEINKPDEDIKQEDKGEPEQKDREDCASIVSNSKDETGEITKPIEDLGQNEENEMKPDDKDSTFGNKESKDESQKKSKSKKRGDSVLMLNSVFSAAVRNSLKNDSGVGENSGSALEPPNLIVTNDRRKKFTLAEKIVIDEDNMATCMICNKKIINDEWKKHNRDVHYNLAWREGELELETHTTVSDFVSHIEKCNGIVSSDGLVICAMCKQEMVYDKWALHKQKQHNNLAWRIGDHPLSVIGFLSHQSQCGLNVEEAQVKCEFCDRRMLPVSIPTHLKMVHETPKIGDMQHTSSYFGVDINASMSKRKAAEMAMLVIDTFSKEKIVQEYAKYFLQNIDFKEENFVTLLLQEERAENHMIKCKFKNCVFESDEVRTLMDHLDLCENKPDQYYTCKRCLLICDTEEEIKEHIKTAHNIVIIDDDFKADCGDENAEKYDEEGMEMYYNDLKKKMRIEKKKLEKDANYKIKPAFLFKFSKRPGRIFPYAYNYTMEFKLNNFLGIATIFCGGPIYAMAWMPTPHTSLNKQILAVAAASDFDTKYLVNENYNDSCVIQLWNFGILKNKQNITEPKLMCCLAVDFGPVWHMEWCPSGCLDSTEDNECENKMSRMGLLAVAGSDSVVYIYSIPFLKEEQMGLIYKTKPLLKLCLAVKKEQSLNTDKFYATRISWSLGGGHRYLAVGYTDGMVGLFDLCTSSKLLTLKDDDDVDMILPYKSFQAHTHYISALTLLHVNGGNRWLMTGSFDRDSIVWDLSNDSKVSATKKHIISDGVWLTNWVAYLTTPDESSTNSFQTGLKSYRDYMYERSYITGSLTTITSISSSNWLNGIIHGNSAGEITAMFPHQLLYSLDSEKHFKSYRFFFGCTRLIDKHKGSKERVEEEIEKQKALAHITRSKYGSESSKLILNRENHLYKKYEPITYKEATEKYGLVFCDKKMDDFSDFLTSSRKQKHEDKQELSKPNLYSMQAINKIAYNPNLQASFYYAAGYQVGFVRLRYIKLLEKEANY
ncbi:hypothetical protein NQ314_001633 [Rhamnusium bicolor]|uniref:C2H2-type domain-containing protein n=1 Tax=Rhamnusium bicolor TaxID=1586634 RepID=A0AAV8ZUL0_9CUCU|nr:hypothetical protein NQ314_001633 [Rhamnusium bicolor]